MPHATGSFRVSSMTEDAYDEPTEGGKLTRSSGVQTYHGAIEGRGTVEWLMSFRPDGSARCVGFWHVTASVDEREGSFVVESVGEFDGKASRGTLSVVEGMGTGELQSMRGSGTFEAPGGADANYELDYDLA